MFGYYFKNQKTGSESYVILGVLNCFNGHINLNEDDLEDMVFRLSKCSEELEWAVCKRKVLRSDIPNEHLRQLNDSLFTGDTNKARIVALEIMESFKNDIGYQKYVNFHQQFVEDEYYDRKFDEGNSPTDWWKRGEQWDGSFEK